jgi:cob(I)alamin adenosyltransferase
VQQFGRSTALAPDCVDARDVERAKEALDAANAVAASGEYDLVILDQVILALHWNLIELRDLLALLVHRHRNVELILTGRCAPAELIAAADLVTEMQQVKGSPREGAAVC